MIIDENINLPKLLRHFSEKISSHFVCHLTRNGKLLPKGFTSQSRGLKGVQRCKNQKLTVDEQFEMYVLIKNADVRLAKNGEKIYRFYFPRYFWDS